MAILTLVARPEGFEGAITQIEQSKKYFDLILPDETDQLQAEIKTVIQDVFLKTINSLLETSQAQKTQFQELVISTKAELEEFRTKSSSQIEEQKQTLMGELDQ